MSNVMVGVAGLVIGSFLNLVIYRLPRGEKVVFTRSKCPKCGHLLGVRDLIPIFSFVAVRGRCRFCGDPISLRYPIVELLTAAVYIGGYHWFGMSLPFFVFVIFVSMLVVALFTDIEHQIIPDEITLGGLMAGLVLAWILTHRFWESVGGAVVGGGILMVISSVARLIYKKEAMGGGDVKLTAMIGSFVGISGVLVAIYSAFIFGFIGALGAMIVNKKGLRDYIPFGPYLVLGGGLAYVGKEFVWKWMFGI